MKKVYFVCSSDGEVLQVMLTDEDFESDYQGTIGANNGEFLATCDPGLLVHTLSKHFQRKEV